VDPDLVWAVIKAESNFNPRAVSRKGARGLMQLMPVTARLLEVDNAYNPTENVNGGVRYLRSLLDRFRGNRRLALAAYNAGAKAVEQYKNVPPYAETREYVRRVLNYYRLYRNNGGVIASDQVKQ
jgi:soluble lytic murein transglycosylase